MSTYNDPKITEITGTITLSDGSTNHFSMSYDSWDQWGETPEILGYTVTAIEAMRDALAADDLFYTGDEDDNDEDEDED